MALETVREAVTMEEEKRKTSRELEKLIFQGPEFVEATTKSPLAVTLRSITQTEFTINVTSYDHIEKEYRSRLPEILEDYAEEIVLHPPLPRWKYYTPLRPVSIGTVLDAVKTLLNGESNLLRLTSIEELTNPKLLNAPFKVSSQLEAIVKSLHKARATYILNTHDGIDIATEIESYSEPGRTYSIILSVVSKPRPVIRAFCSCPVASKGLLCKHISTAIAANISVLAALDRLLDGAKKPLDYYINKWKQNVANMHAMISATQGEGVLEGVIYYLNRFLQKKDLIEIVKVPSAKVTDIKSIVYHLTSGALTKDELAKQGILERVVVKKPREITVRSAKELQTTKIVWTALMKKYREKVNKFIQDLSERFGLLAPSMKSGEWPTLLAFATVMSVDYTKPPIVLHAVGSPGTFKTMGARLLDLYITIPEQVYTYRGADVSQKYKEFLALLSRTLEIPYSQLENVVGGIVSSIKTGSDYLEIALNYAAVLSHCRKFKDGQDRLRRLMEGAAKLGFKTSMRASKPRVAVLDVAQIDNIEDYRVKYLPDKQLGLLKIMDVFDNHVVVIDEGSRNPAGLETLLTKMSISTATESVRVLIITDNIEPFQEVMSNPRFTPLHDRTYKVLTRALKDEITVMENLYSEPSVRFNQVELLAVQSFIEKIPVPEGVLYLARAIGNALEYKYGVVSVAGDERHLRILSRDEEASIELDPYQGLNFRFISGGRFLYHTIMLAKFFAFLNGHDEVTLDDMKNALIYTIKSRLVVDAETYSDYKLKVLEIVARVSETLKKGEYYMSVATKFMEKLVYNTPDLEAFFNEQMDKADREDPFLASVLVSTLELAVAIYDIDLRSLPKNVMYTAVELKLLKGDIADLLDMMDVVEEILRARKEEIKGE